MQQGARKWAVVAVAVALGACGANTDEYTVQPEAPGGLDAPVYDEAGKRILPNWATLEEQHAAQQAAAQQGLDSTTQNSARAAPSGTFRVPAEYEPIQAVVMTWTAFTPMLQGTAQAAAAAGAQIWVVGGPRSISGVPSNLYRPLSFDFDTVWARDYGPVGFNEATGKLGVVDTTYRHFASRFADDAIPCSIAGEAGASCYATPLVLDGGNFMTDTKGNVFFTTRIYDWNPRMSREQVDQHLRDYFGAKTLHVFDYAKRGSQPADGTGHLDMFVKLVNDCRVLVAETQDEPFRTVTEKAASYFANLDCPEGRKYEVLRVDGWVSGSAWHTYTNSLIVNDTVIIPNYRNGDDEKARQTYAAAMPGHKVVGVNSDQSITMGGSIHCVTQNIPMESKSVPPQPAPGPAPSPVDTLEQAATQVPLSIPDANRQGITSTLTVSTDKTVTGLEVDVDIAHRSIGQLQVTLLCPDGTAVPLHNRSGGSADNIRQTYPVTACNGQSAAGTWRLQVTDFTRFTTGSLRGWTLRVR